ncbi:MAG: hypothetical protein RLZZ306_2934 [Bacteroidota bacterium]|jgi:hypothetical protein
METKINSSLKLDRSNFMFDSSLTTNYESAINSPDILRMRDELRAFVKKMNERKVKEE